MNQGENKQLKGKNIGVVVAIIVIALVCIVGLGVGGYYLYALGTLSDNELGEFEGDYSFNSGCASCQSDYEDTGSISTNTPTPIDIGSQEKYTNSRYGFEITPPRGFSSFESENGDGVTYTHPDAITIRVFGANNSEGLILNQYLDKETDQLKTDTGDAKETGVNEVGLDGCEGERRAWEYTSPIDGTKTTMEKAVCLRDDVFYVMELITSNDNYYDYSTIFDQVVFGFKFK